MSLSRPRVETSRQLVPLPAALVDELAHGHGGAEAVRHLALFQQSLRHRLLAEVCSVADARRGETADALARPTAHAVETLRHLDSDARCHAAVADVLAHPCLRTWAVRVLEQESPQPADVAHLAAVAGAAAIRAGADADVAVPVRHGAVHLPTLGRLVIAPHQRPHPDGAAPCADCRAPEDGAEHDVALVDLRIRGGSCSITAAPGWQAVRAIPLLGLAGGALAVEDTDPYRADGDADVADRIPREEWDLWRRTASDAWDLLQRDHARHAAGIAAGLSTLIPLSPVGLLDSEVSGTEGSAEPEGPRPEGSGPDGPQPEGLRPEGPGPESLRPEGLSPSSEATVPGVPAGRASERPAFGSVATALPRHGDPERDAAALALRLVTGFQRAKLAAVLDMADLHDPADPHWPETRWQDAYTHVAAADFWRVRRALAAAGDGREHAEAEFARCQTDAARAVRDLAAHPTLTSLGRRFVDALIETLTEWTPEGR